MLLLRRYRLGLERYHRSQRPSRPGVPARRVRVGRGAPGSTRVAPSCAVPVDVVRYRAYGLVGGEGPEVASRHAQRRLSRESRGDGGSVGRGRATHGVGAVDRWAAVRRPSPQAWEDAAPGADRTARRPRHSGPRTRARWPGWGSEFPIGAGSVNSIGVVEGVECAITASDMTYRGGSMNPRSVDKGERFRDIIRRNRLPWINLNESAGADLPHQADIFIRGGEGFRDQTQLSKLGHPDDHGDLRPEHRRWRLRPGHERLHDLRQGARHRVPRRAAAREDGDRRSGRRRDTGRCRDAQPHVRSERLPRGRRDGRAADGPRHRSAPALAEARSRSVRIGRRSRSTTRTS